MTEASASVCLVLATALLNLNQLKAMHEKRSHFARTMTKRPFHPKTWVVSYLIERASGLAKRTIERTKITMDLAQKTIGSTTLYIVNET